MEENNIEHLRYPIGRFTLPKNSECADRDLWIQEISDLPKNLTLLVKDLSEKQLDTPYRDDGWSVRQVIHHIADSHLNSYVRFKWAITEEEPLIKPYMEKKWSMLQDAKTMEIQSSLTLVSALHIRWVYFLRGLDDQDFNRRYTHPEWVRPLSLGPTLALYAWHGKHHLAHIKNLMTRKDW